MLSLFVAAFLLGLLFNAAPGAVFAETVRQGVRGGFRPALSVQLGSLAGDALWAALGLAGVGLLAQAESLRVPVGVAGVLYLLWLAVDSWRAANAPFGAPAAAAAASERALRAGVLLSLTNPQNVAYWAALGSAMGAVGVRDPAAFDYGVFFAGFMASSLVWAFVCAAFVARLFSAASDGWARLTYRACAIAFLLLALSSLRDLTSQAPGKAAVSAVDRSGSRARWALRNASGEQPVQIPAARSGQFAVDP
jgi:chemosensory pili system protein ChpE